MLKEIIVNIDRSCNGGATDGESVKVKTTTFFEEDSQTAIANPLFRWIISVKMRLELE